MQHFTWEGTAPERYPVLLDADGEPRKETIRDFLLWLNGQELRRAAGFKEAQKWLVAAMQMERKRRGLTVLGEGKANEYMEVRIVGQEKRIAAGMSKIVAGSDLSKRADRVPDMEDKIKMMHMALSGAAIVHHNPLLVVQTGFEMLCTHATGVRGQLVRSAKFEHIWDELWEKIMYELAHRGFVCHSQANRGPMHGGACGCVGYGSRNVAQVTGDHTRLTDKRQTPCHSCSQPCVMVCRHPSIHIHPSNSQICLTTETVHHKHHP